MSVPRGTQSAGGRNRVPIEHRLALTVAEAADMLSISKSYAYELLERNELPSVRIGNTVRVPKRELERYLENRLHADGIDR
jgi:excisionase family DNA binding protein